LACNAVGASGIWRASWMSYRRRAAKPDSAARLEGMMTKKSLFALAVIPMLTIACSERDNPLGPSALNAFEPAAANTAAANTAGATTVSGAASLAKGRSPSNELCKAIVVVQLAVKENPRTQATTVNASYQFSDLNAYVKCPAPTWDVSPKAPRKIELLDGGFTAVMRFPIEAYKIVATAPNGIQGVVLSAVQDK
jgi:hypothetical protein